MLDLVADLGELSAAISAAVGRTYRLQPLKVKCTYPVFKGEADGVASVFVKVGPKEEWARTVSLLKEIGDCGLFTRFLTDAPIEYNGSAVFVMEWRESRMIFPEDMSDHQAEGFVAGCVKLSAALQKAGGVLGITHRSSDPLRGGLRPADSPTDLAPERLYGDIAQYGDRHRVAGRLIKGLLDLPAAERTFGSRPLSVIHGDFHAKNFGFVGDDLAAVFDFDKLTEGLACGDLVNALVERFSCLGLSASTRRRLMERTRFIVRCAPWPREEMVISCNALRLQFAARRIKKHPGSAWVALDVFRRDRRIREFLSCLEGLS